MYVYIYIYICIYTYIHTYIYENDEYEAGAGWEGRGGRRVLQLRGLRGPAT